MGTAVNRSLCFRLTFYPWVLYMGRGRDVEDTVVLVNFVNVL